MTSEMSWIPPYQTTVVLTETTDGEPVFEARHPELPRVLGQGDTPEEAVADLAEATAVVLEHFRDHNVPIPAARPLDAPIEMMRATPARTLAAAREAATLNEIPRAERAEWIGAFVAECDYQRTREINIERVAEIVAARKAAASALGSVRSAAKSAAARENGKRGGRPRKTE